MDLNNIYEYKQTNLEQELRENGKLFQTLKVALSICES